ncbi:MAG: arsenic transporter [Candidatus Acidiferrales bacterium]
MPTSHAASLLIWTISLASIVLMLVRPRRIAEAYWICGGAILLITARLLPLREAGHAVYEGLDVYLFLAGMMILAELARDEGVFDWIADVAARHSGDSPARLFTLIYVTGIVVTAVLSNDATAVVLTPAVLAAVRRVRVEPKPYLLACAFIANAASFIFPISNPANLVVFGRTIPPLVHWLHIFILPSIAAVIVTYLCLYWLSRRELAGKLAPKVESVSLSFKGKLALAGLVCAAAALIVSSAMGLPLGLPTCGAAVFATAIVTWYDTHIPLRIAKGVSWSILPLVAGLFVIVEAMQKAGLLRMGLDGLKSLSQNAAWMAKGAAAFSVALLSNGMNNLPVGLMSGAAIQNTHSVGIIAHAILLGVDLGPTLSVTGSLATILWLIALRRENLEITAWEFFKVGMIVMPIALIASLLFLWS